MNFYRVIKKESDCDVVMAIFISKLAAFEYYYSMVQKYGISTDSSWFVDDIKGNIELSKSFIGKNNDSI